MLAIASTLVEETRRLATARWRLGCSVLCSERFLRQASVCTPDGIQTGWQDRSSPQKKGQPIYFTHL